MSGHSSARGLLVRDIPLLRPPRFDVRRSTAADRIPSTGELRPFRPGRRPRWSPPRRRLIERLEPFEASSATLRSAEGLGQVRINFSYRNYISTTADFGDKSGRQQFCEGHVEDDWRRWLLVNANCVDVEFQPIEATFTDADGMQRTVTWDVGIELVEPPLIFAEIKVNRDYFEDARTKENASLSAAALRPLGCEFARLMGSDFDSVSRRTVKEVFDCRRAKFDPEVHLHPVIEAIDTAGGELPLGRAIEVAGGAVGGARARFCAMMAKRHLALDLNLPLTDDTPVRRAPTARGAGALRRFLAERGAPAK